MHAAKTRSAVKLTSRSCYVMLANYIFYSGFLINGVD